jgi:hypothetical protein
MKNQTKILFIGKKERKQECAMLEDRYRYCAFQNQSSVLYSAEDRLLGSPSTSTGSCVISTQVRPYRSKSCLCVSPGLFDENLHEKPIWSDLNFS